MIQENDTNQITSWMQQLAVDPSLRPLEDPDLLWLKSQLSFRCIAVERAMKPAEWCNTIARTLVGFAACWLALIWAKSLVVSAMGSANPTWLSLLVSAVIAGVALAAYPILAGD